MEISDLKLDKEAIVNAMELRGNQYIAKEPISILAPARWLDRNFILIGDKTYILGYFLYVLQDKKKYLRSNAPTMIPITPDARNDMYLDGDPYVEFTFDTGSPVLSNEVMIDDKLLYFVHGELLSRGNIPVYMDYDMRARLLDHTRHFNGVRLASSITILHLLLSMISRDADDPTRYYRHALNDRDNPKLMSMPIRSITHGATNANAKLMGGYFSDKVTSALVNQTDKVERIEAIMRM